MHGPAGHRSTCINGCQMPYVRYSRRMDTSELMGAFGALAQETARIDWTLGDAETLAAETRAQVGEAALALAGRDDIEHDAGACEHVDGVRRVGCRGCGPLR